MYRDLSDLRVGDRIYTQRRFSDMIYIHTITGETTKAWVIEIGMTKSQVRKKDGYLMGSDSGGRFPDKVYYSAVTPEIVRERSMQVLSRKIELLGTAKVAVTTESYDELRAAVDTIYRHVTPDPKKS